MKLLITFTTREIRFPSRELTHIYNEYLGNGIWGTIPVGHDMFGFELDGADAVICEVLGCPHTTRAGLEMCELMKRCHELDKPFVFLSPIHGFNKANFTILEASKFPPFRNPRQDDEYKSMTEWRDDVKRLFNKAIASLHPQGAIAHA